MNTSPLNVTQRSETLGTSEGPEHGLCRTLWHSLPQDKINGMLRKKVFTWF